VSVAQLIHSFVTDVQTKTVFAMIVLDLVLGVLAALKLGTFRLAFLANFARNDVLGKVIPFFALHSAALVAGEQNVVIPGFDISMISDAVFGLVAAAMVGSILGSLADLGLSAIPPALGSTHSSPPSAP
jgi:hypothetical protein